MACTLRRAVADDEGFLHALYADRRAPELAGLGWSDEQVSQFVAMQFRAQRHGYATTFPDATDWIVVLDGSPVGRLLLDDRPGELRVVDIVIHSECRGRGHGSALMAGVLDQASAAGQAVALTVARWEEHLVRWYRRLGFTTVGEDDLDLRLLWRPG